MQLLARLMDHALTARGERTTIVVATSGDTGGAAVEAFRGRAQADVFVLFPHGRISDVQRRMMTTRHRRQRACARDRRHLRRLPGAGEGHVQPPRLPRPGAALRRQFDQLGAHRRAGGLLLHRRGRARRAARARSPSPCRPAISATSSPAMSPQRMGLPVDRLVIATNVNDILARTLATGSYELRDVVRDHLAVDGHPGVVEFRAAAVRGLSAATRAAVRALMGSLAQSRRFSLSVERAVGDPRAVHRRPRRRGGDRRDHPHRYCARPATASIRTPRSASRSRKRKPAIRRCRWSCSRTAHPAKFPDAVEAACGVRPALAGLARRSCRAAGARHRGCRPIRRRSNDSSSRPAVPRVKEQLHER